MLIIVRFMLLLLILGCAGVTKDKAPREKISDKKNDSIVIERWDNGLPKRVLLKSNEGNTSLIKDYYKNGDIRRIIPMKGEKIHGVYRSFLKDIRIETNYIHGVKHGAHVIFSRSNKQILMKGAYKNDEKIGRWKYYNEDGSLKKVNSF